MHKSVTVGMKEVNINCDITLTHSLSRSFLALSVCRFVSVFVFVD